MVRPKKLILSLDALPRDVVTGRERRPSHPRARRVGSTRTRNPKRKRANTPAEQSDASDAKPTKSQKRVTKEQNSEVKSEIKTENDTQEPENEQKFVQIVGIDAGMSGSGMSFASIKADPSVVIAELTWPGSFGKSEKVPSLVAMLEDNRDHHDFQNGRISSFFGYEVPAGTVYRSYYKASLDGIVRGGIFDDPVLASDTAGKLVRIDEPIRNREALRTTLRHLKEIHLAKARAALGEMFSATTFRYVFTHPAACSQQGIELLRRLVVEAGFDDNIGNRPEFLSEAHAAAMAGFIGCKSQHGSQAWKVYFKQGALVTVIDIGALTVDLTTVRIRANDPKLALTEATVPSGGRCGTSAIHCHLMETLTNKFGDAFSQLPNRIFAPNSPFFRRCEEHLRTFDDTRPHQRYRISLKLPEGTYHRDYDEDAEEISITSAELKGAVDAALQYSKALLLDQWNQPKKYNDVDFQEEDVQTTMFCGGGSLIPYVYKELGTFCEQHGVRFMRAKDPESTVCRGAVISLQREDLYGKRLSRASFGIEVEEGGRQYVKWFIDKGTDLDTSQEVVITRVAGHVFVTYEDVLNHARSFEMPILMYENDGETPDSAEDPDIQKISTIKIGANTMSTYLRKKLQDQMTQKKAQKTPLAVSVTVSVDRSARLFFEAKHGLASLGKGELRLDSTIQAT